MRAARFVVALASIVPLAAAFGGAAEPPIPSERISFPSQATSATRKGQIKGDGARDYVLGAAAGQTMTVKLASKNRFANCNVLAQDTMELVPADPPPRETTAWTGALPKTGDYVIRVYLVPAEARRMGVAAYTLSVAITGAAAHAATGEIPKTITYVCDNATDLTATYINADPGSARVTIKDKTYQLPHVPSGSGTKYSDGTVTFWNKGRDGMFEAPGLTFNCTEK